MHVAANTGPQSKAFFRGVVKKEILHLEDPRAEAAAICSSKMLLALTVLLLGIFAEELDKPRHHGAELRGE